MRPASPALSQSKNGHPIVIGKLGLVPGKALSLVSEVSQKMFDCLVIASPSGGTEGTDKGEPSWP